MSASTSQPIGIVSPSDLDRARKKSAGKAAKDTVSDSHHDSKDVALEPPPGASPQMRKLAQRVKGPVEHFLHTETAGGIVLLLAAAGALIWANSSFSHSYHDLWHSHISLGIGSWHAEVNLHFMINEVLMTIFFLLAGLEIKREIVEGELSDLRRASLPIAAAIGGMLVPALIFYAFNPTGPTSGGWGVPMATDIAFAVGILSLLGKRVPASMRILLLALAIIDDLGAILVIAIFYPIPGTAIDSTDIGIVVAGLLCLGLWLRLGLRPGPLFLIPLGIIWTGLHGAGIHPTLAGVIVGLATPVRPWLSKEQFLMTARKSIEDFERAAESDEADAHHLVEPVNRLHFAAREALSPVVRGLSEMHVWVAFGIMPLFALANAGVDLGGVDMSQPGAMKLMLGIAFGLAVGKPIGVMAISWLLCKTGLGSLPKGLPWSGMLVIGLTAGIGFTMAIFIAGLAFSEQPELLGLAKLAILIGTAGAAIVGLIIGKIVLKPLSEEIAALSPTDVERSTEY